MQHGGLVSFVPDRRLLVMLKIKPARNPADEIDNKIVLPHLLFI